MGLPSVLVKTLSSGGWIFAAPSTYRTKLQLRRPTIRPQPHRAFLFFWVLAWRIKAHSKHEPIAYPAFKTFNSKYSKHTSHSAPAVVGLNFSERAPDAMRRRKGAQKDSSFSEPFSK